MGSFAMGVPPKLSDGEWDVLKPFWERGPMAARDVFAAVPGQREWSYRTVKTMLSRLVTKEALTYERVGNSYLYRPVYSRAEMTREATGSFIDRVFDGALRPFVAHFAESISDEELALLKSEIQAIEERKRRERS